MYNFTFQNVLDDTDVFEIQHCIDVQCVRHLHCPAEIVLVTVGVLRVLFNEHEIVLHSGEGLYIMPFEVHGFATDEHSACTIITFSPSLVPDFAAASRNKRPEQPVFCPTSAVIALCSVVDPTAEHDTLHRRSVLYPLCCEIVDACRFSAGGHVYEKTFVRVTRYVADNVSAPLSLESTAAAVGLNPKYLSRMFRQVSGMGFWDYVNILRCSYAARLLTTPQPTEPSVAEVAYASGFGSIRTFNRVFRTWFGISPSQMKQEHN